MRFGERTISKHDFSLVGSVRVSVLAEHNQAIKTATRLEKSRYVIFTMQTGQKNVMSEDINRFDDWKLTNAKLYLNSKCYPYDDLNLDFDKNRCAILYDLYAQGLLRIRVSRTESHLYDFFT